MSRSIKILLQLKNVYQDNTNKDGSYASYKIINFYIIRHIAKEVTPQILERFEGGGSDKNKHSFIHKMINFMREYAMKLLYLTYVISKEWFS